MPPDPHVHVGVAAVVELDDQVLMLKRGGEGEFASDGRGQWSLPGGWLDFGETPMEAAQREALEETGVAVRAAAELGWVQCHSESTKAQIITLIVRCHYAFGAPTVKEPDKCPEVRWVDRAEIAELELFAPTRKGWQRGLW